MEWDGTGDELSGIRSHGIDDVECSVPSNVNGKGKQWQTVHGAHRRSTFRAGLEEFRRICTSIGTPPLANSHELSTLEPKIRLLLAPVALIRSSHGGSTVLQVLDHFVQNSSKVLFRDTNPKGFYSRTSRIHSRTLQVKPVPKSQKAILAGRAFPNNWPEN